MSIVALNPWFSLPFKSKAECSLSKHLLNNYYVPGNVCQLPGRDSFSRPSRIKKNHLCPWQRNSHYNLKWSVLERIKSGCSAGTEGNLSPPPTIIHSININGVPQCLGKAARKKISKLSFEGCIGTTQMKNSKTRNCKDFKQDFKQVKNFKDL